jgi:hypothetical protein
MNALKESAAACARESLANGCETMKQLLLGLLDAKGRVADEVHAIRKLGKSLRGGFALFRLEKSAAREIQAINRLLSGTRDAVSLAHTWQKLAWNASPPVADAIAAMLGQQTHSANRRPPPNTIAWCVERVDAARMALDEVADGDLADRMASGLAWLERRVLKRCRKLGPHADEDFHQARKAIKAWLGACGFLVTGMVPQDPKLDMLAALLGDENDLASLSVWLKNHGFGNRFAPDLWQKLKVTRREVQQEVIRDVAGLSLRSPV